MTYVKGIYKSMTIDLISYTCETVVRDFHVGLEVLGTRRLRQVVQVFIGKAEMAPAPPGAPSFHVTLDVHRTTQEAVVVPHASPETHSTVQRMLDNYHTSGGTTSVER